MYHTSTLCFFSAERETTYYKSDRRSRITHTYTHTYIHRYTHTRVKIFSFSIYEIGRTDRTRRFHRGKLCGSYVLCRPCKLSDGNACFFSGVVDGEIDDASIFRKGQSTLTNIFFMVKYRFPDFCCPIRTLCVKKIPLSHYIIS